MKKSIITFLLCLVALIVTSCTLSNEEKAEKLIKETLKEELFHPDSYEPLSTKVDSMFVDVDAIEPIMQISDEIEKLLSQINECESELELAESLMDIYTPDGYSSQYSVGEYARQKKEKEEVQSDLDKYANKLSKKLASLKENVSKFRKGKFTGWIVTHKFRSLNGKGSMTIPGEMIFFCDKEFTSCSSYQVEMLGRVATIVKTVEEATSDEDVIDYFKDNSFLL